MNNFWFIYPDADDYQEGTHLQVGKIVGRSRDFKKRAGPFLAGPARRKPGLLDAVCGALKAEESVHGSWATSRPTQPCPWRKPESSCAWRTKRTRSSRRPAA